MSAGFLSQTKKPILALAYTAEDYQYIREWVKHAKLGKLIRCGQEDVLKLHGIGNN